MKLKSKLFASAVAFTMVLSMVAVPVSAQTTAELTAQINALLAQIAQLQAQISGTTTTAGTTFTTDLTLGSKGAEVTALQTWLVSKGHLVMPAGVAMGYFGPLTQAAVAKYQVSAGITPAAGYFGPITRAKVNAMGGTTTTSGTTTGSTGITTPGAEGTFTVSQAASPANNTNVTSNNNVPVYGMKVKSSGSDIAIQRVSLQFSVTVNSVAVNPSQFIKSISVMDGSNTLRTMPVSSADFIKDSSNLYYVQLTGINFIVPKGTEKVLSFNIDTNAVGSSDYTRAVTVEGYSSTNVRGVDGAGIDSYQDASWVGSFTFTASNNATLTATANANTPKAQTIAVDTTDGVKNVIMQTVDFKSTVGSSNLTDLRVYVKTDSGTYSAPTSLYLYDGSTLLGSAAVTVTSGSGTVNFTNLDVPIAKDVTKTLTIKADFPSTATGVASTTVRASGSETNTTMFETSDETSKEVTISSDLVGNNVHLLVAAAPKWELVSTNITPTVGVVDVASSTVNGTIVLKVTANGGTITKPTAGQFSVWFASSTPATRTTNGGTGYSAANAITVASPTVTVTPNDATVGDGSSYIVTITGTLFSSNASFGAAIGTGYNMFMAIESIDTDMTPNGGDITDQTWGIDNFYTNSALLTKSTK